MLFPKTTPFHKVTDNIKPMTWQEYTHFFQHVGIPGDVQWHQCRESFSANELSLLVLPGEQWTAPTVHLPKLLTYNTTFNA